MRVLGLLDNTVVVVSSDHGHSLGEQGYMGKRPYPVGPEAYDIPLMVRFPKAEHAGARCDAFIDHTAISASIPDAAGIAVPARDPEMRRAVSPCLHYREA